MGYIHNPMMHGPLQIELTALIFYFLGDNDFTARILYAFAGSILILMPLLLRSIWGKTGGLSVALLIAISPTLLYFSRFSRNDILMSVLVFALVSLMWSYLKNGRPRTLYGISGVLALAYATKETAYIITIILGVYLILKSITGSFNRVSSNTELGTTSLPKFVANVASHLFTSFQNSMNMNCAPRHLSVFPRHISVFILIFTLTLTQWSALVGILQNTPLLEWTNLTLLATADKGQVGMPIGGGKVLALFAILGFLILSVMVGRRWCWGIWWRCAAIFYSTWILLYTTFLTNITGGIWSGVWQSLGYWIVQQGEGRGGQPWYYYLILTPIYEYLPLIVSLIATWYYIKKRDGFGIFLVYWFISTLILYTIASEKMPWLLVNITLPMIALSGKFMGQIIGNINSRKLSLSPKTISLIIPFTLLLILWSIIQFAPNTNPILDRIIPLIIIATTVCLIAISIKLSNRVRDKTPFYMAFAGTCLILMILTFRTAVITNFTNGDIPVEMLVYTQTSPDIPIILNGFKKLDDSKKPQSRISITIDQTSGFTWPWSWYLRDYPHVDYPTYGPKDFNNMPATDAVLIHSNNNGMAENLLAKDFKEGQRVPHRWWFPEDNYRNLTPLNIIDKTFDLKTWHALTEYWFHRKGISKDIGSEDFYLYVKDEFPTIETKTNNIRLRK